jgi:hypothetical protein
VRSWYGTAPVWAYCCPASRWAGPLLMLSARAR